MNVKNVNNLWLHEQSDGYDKNVNVVNTTTLSVSYQLNRYDAPLDELPEELVERELAYKLGAEIMKGNVATHYKHFDQENFKETIVATITVCPPEVKFKNVINDIFVVNGEQFSEAEIIKAIRHTYPERLI